MLSGPPDTETGPRSPRRRTPFRRAACPSRLQPPQTPGHRHRKRRTTSGEHRGGTAYRGGRGPGRRFSASGQRKRAGRPGDAEGGGRWEQDDGRGARRWNPAIRQGNVVMPGRARVRHRAVTARSGTTAQVASRGTHRRRRPAGRRTRVAPRLLVPGRVRVAEESGGRVERNVREASSEGGTMSGSSRRTLHAPTAHNPPLRHPRSAARRGYRSGDRERSTQHRPGSRHGARAVGSTDLGAETG